MKHLLKISIIAFVAALAMCFTSCESDNNEANSFNGTYGGFALESDSTVVSSWVMIVRDGIVTITSTSDSVNMTIGGTITPEGNIVASGTLNGTTIVIEGLISGNDVSGTWVNTNLGDNGIIKGNKISTEFDGTYSGNAYQGTGIVTEFKMTINSGIVIIQNNTTDGDFYMYGTVNSQGNIIATGTQDVVKIDIDATIEGGNISGTWSGSDSNTGTITGSKISSDFDGTYIGSAYQGETTTIISTWIMTISNGIVGVVITSNESEELTMTGLVNSQGVVNVSGTDPNDFVLIVNGTISENDFSGKWFSSNNENNIGNISGTKN